MNRVFLAHHLLAMAVNVSLVVDVVIGIMLVFRKIGNGYGMFVIGARTIPSAGASATISANSNFARMANVIVLNIIMLVIFFIIYRVVLMMALS